MHTLFIHQVHGPRSRSTTRSICPVDKCRVLFPVPAVFVLTMTRRCLMLPCPLNHLLCIDTSSYYDHGNTMICCVITHSMDASHTSCT